MAATHPYEDKENDYGMQPGRSRSNSMLSEYSQGILILFLFFIVFSNFYLNLTHNLNIFRSKQIEIC